MVKLKPLFILDVNDINITSPLAKDYGGILKAQELNLSWNGEMVWVKESYYFPLELCYNRKKLMAGVETTEDCYGFKDKPVNLGGCLKFRLKKEISWEEL